MPNTKSGTLTPKENTNDLVHEALHNAMTNGYHTFLDQSIISIVDDLMRYDSSIEKMDREDVREAVRSWLEKGNTNAKCERDIQD